MDQSLRNVLSKEDHLELERLEGNYQDCIGKGHPVFFFIGTTVGTIAGIKLRAPGRLMRSYGCLIGGAVVGQMGDFFDMHLRCRGYSDQLEDFNNYLIKKYSL